MIVPAGILRMKSAVTTMAKRNVAATSVLCANVSDPIQKLFLDKISEFKSKINDPTFLKENPKLSVELKEELSRVTRQYGGNSPDDLAKFPQAKIEQPQVDPQKGF